MYPTFPRTTGGGANRVRLLISLKLPLQIEIRINRTRVLNSDCTHSEVREAHDSGPRLEKRGFESM